MIRRFIRGAVLPALAILLLVVSPQSAAASNGHAQCNGGPDLDRCYASPQSGYPQAAVTTYNDAPDELCALDTRKDGHSAVAKYWPLAKPWQAVNIWAAGGQYDTVCRSLAHLPENADYVIQACIGEYADRRVVACGNQARISL
jgi:hypothetical protein